MRTFIALCALMMAVAGCGSSSSSNHSAALEHAITTEGSRQLRTNLSSLGSKGTVAVNDAHCTKTGGTQNYTCIAHYTVNDPTMGLNNQKYKLDITATCTSSGNCRWHAAGNGVAVAR